MEKKLNNLLSMTDFSFDKLNKKAKTTKHTGVAKDILESKSEKDDKKVVKCECDCDEKDDKKGKKELSAAQKKLPKALQDKILKESDEITETKEIILKGKYNNLISLDDFGKKDLPKNDKKNSKRTSVGKDIISEKKVRPEDIDEDGEYCDKKKTKKCKPGEEDGKEKNKK